MPLAMKMKATAAISAPMYQVKMGSRVRLDRRVGVVTYVAAGFADVDFPGGDWCVVPVGRLELDADDAQGESE